MIDKNNAPRIEQPSGKYVVGFLFKPGYEMVVLIEKKRPLWQLGKLNGIGGHIEAGETPVEAMVREFREEAGVEVGHWFHFRTEHFIHGSQVKVCFFAALATADQWWALSSQTDEILFFTSLPIDRKNSERLLYNLPYLIPMASVLLHQPLENIPAP
jgi:8-oxo-dGTP diphosphatase